MSFSPLYRGSNSLGTSRALSTGYANGESFTLAQAQPVAINGSGQMVHVDITSDASVAGILGVCAASTPTTANGEVYDCGRLETITTSFSIGDAVYINTDGTLINTRPSLGVGGFTVGMYVISIGVIVQNQFNPSNKDLKIYLNVLGQL